MKDNQKKILPMKYPEITSFPYHANLLSILSINENNLSWFYNYYFQLASMKGNEPRLDFYSGYSMRFIKNCPHITFHGLSRNFIGENWNTLTEFIISSINAGYYLYFLVDKYYISAYEHEYMKFHAPHDIFVFGYNKSEQNFYIADFFKYAKYYYSTCSFQNIEDGYKAQNDRDWLNGCILLKQNPVYFPINITLLKNFMIDYLSSKNSYKIITSLFHEWLTDDEFAFGMQVYDIIEKHIEEVSNKLAKLDLRTLHVLWDHKKYVLQLIKYLYKLGYLCNSDYLYKKFLPIENKALILRNLMLKYNLSENKVIIDKAITILKELASEEKQVLLEMLDNLIETPLSPKIPIDTYIDNESVYVEYSEKWKKEISQNNKSYYTENKNSYVQFRFYGSSISYIGTKSKNCGCADIYLDGIKCESVNLFSSEDVYQYTLFSRDDLPLGHHIIRVACSEINESVSSGNKITLDGFETRCDGDSKVKIGNEVVFVGINNTTKGLWKSSFGIEGYEIIGVESRVPKFAYVSYHLQSIWACSTKDVRALEIPGSSECRIASCKYNNDFFTIDLIIAGNSLKDITFYILDYDKLSREVYIEFIDFNTKQVISFQNIKDAYKGVYLMFKMKGHFLINFHSTGSPNAVLSGIFFG